MVIKKILKIVLVSIIVLLALLLIIPVIFKDRIVEALRTEINKQIDAEVDFSNVSLSLFRSFPNLNVRIDDFSISGQNKFEGVNLIKTERSSITINLSSLWKKDSPYKVRSLVLDGLELNLLILSDGTANYNILKVDENGDLEDIAGGEDAGDEFSFDLSSYEIRNGNIFYEDRGSSNKLAIYNINHGGNGNFSADVFTLKTQTVIDELYWSYGGVPYIYALPVNWELDILADFNTSVFEIIHNELELNRLSLNFEGVIKLLENDDMEVDLKLNAPGNDFEELFSIFPIAALAGLDQMNIRGDFNLVSEMKGLYSNTQDIFPALLLKLDVRDAFVHYPEMDLPIDQIQMDLSVNKPKGTLDELIIDLSSFNFKLGSNPFKSSLLVSNPVSNPLVKSTVDGRLNLDEFSRIFPIEGFDQLAGNIEALLNAEFRWEDVENAAWDQLTFNGKIDIKSLDFAMTGYPAIKIPSAAAVFDERSTTIASSKIEIGRSDISMEGSLGNILAMFAKNHPLKGNLVLGSQLFDVDEMMKLFSTDGDEGGPSISDQYDEFPGFFNVDIDATVNADRILFDYFEITEVKAIVNLQPHLLTLNNASVVINGSDIRGSLDMEQWYEFAMYGERITLDANLASRFLDIDRLMPPSADAVIVDESGVRSEDVSVPDFLYNIHLVGRAEKAVFNDMEMNDFNTNGYLTERDIHIHSFSSVIFGDRIAGSGFIGNYMNYIYLDETLVGELEIQSGSLNMNNWMEAFMSEGEDDTAASQTETLDEMEAIVVPANLDIGIKGRLNRLQYFDLVFSNVSGNIEIKDAALAFRDFEGEIFNGKLGLNGIYDTAEEDPFVNMKMEIQNFNIPTAFQNMKTLSAVAPLFEYMNGFINSEFIMNTRLGKGMMPLWNSFNAEGFFQTKDASVLNLPLLQNLGERLKVSEFKKLYLDNTENWFKINNGTFELQPTTHNISGTTMGFSGSHLIGGEMDYLIEASIPKSKIGSSPAGETVVSGLNFIQSEASKRGINLGDGSNVDVGIQLGGTLLNPSVSISLMGVSSGQTISQQVEGVVRDRIEQETDRIRDRAADEIQDRRDMADSLIRSTTDSLREIARKKEEELREKARKEAEAQLKDLLKDTTGTDPVENIKERVRKFNPFKRGNDDG